MGWEHIMALDYKLLTQKMHFNRQKKPVNGSILKFYPDKMQVINNQYVNLCYVNLK